MRKVGKSLKSRLSHVTLRLWGMVVRQRDGDVCQMEGCGRAADNPHHIFSRKGHLSVKFDLNNGILLCWACHNHKAHGPDPEGFRDFVVKDLDSKVGRYRYNALKRIAHEIAQHKVHHITEFALEFIEDLCLDMEGLREVVYGTPGLLVAAKKQVMEHLNRELKLPTAHMEDKT